jgi:hypothetical protein
VQMWVMRQTGSPTMQDGEEADFCAQVFGIIRYSAQGFGGGLEEDVVNDLLVLVSDRSNLIWHCEDDVVVLAVKKFCLTMFDPLCAFQ